MIIIISGVAGSGKSTVGRLLSERIGWPFIEGDDYHSDSAKKKMASGTPLSDDDRKPWLEALNAALVRSEQEDQDIILACSALTENSRAILLENIHTAHLVWLEGNFDLIKKRMTSRINHFFRPNLLSSQFEIDKKPVSELVIDVKKPLDCIIQEITSFVEGKKNV